MMKGGRLMMKRDHGPTKNSCIPVIGCIQSYISCTSIEGMELCITDGSNFYTCIFPGFCLETDYSCVKCLRIAKY